MKKQQGFAHGLLLLVILVLILIGGTGYYIWHKNKKEPTKPAASTNTITVNNTATNAAKPTDPYAGWQQIRNTQHGYSLKIPNGWVYEDRVAALIANKVASPYLDSTVGALNLSVSSVANESARPGPLVSSESTTINGLPATKKTWEGNGSGSYSYTVRVISIRFQKNDLIYNLEFTSAKANDALFANFDLISKSFSFTN